MDNNKALQFKRNANIARDFDQCKTKLEAMSGADGEIILGRYYAEGGAVETAIGVCYANGNKNSVTVIGTSKKIDVDEIIEDVKAKIEADMKKPTSGSTTTMVSNDDYYWFEVKLSNEPGNLLKANADGLYAEFPESDAFVLGGDGKVHLKVAKDGVIYTDGNGINIGLNLKYDGEKHALYLIDKDGARCSDPISTSKFEQDNFLRSVNLIDASKEKFWNPTTQKYENDGMWLKFEWETPTMDANPIYLNLSDIIKEPIEPIVYDGVSGITIDNESHNISIRLGDDDNTKKFLYFKNKQYSETDKIGLFFNPDGLDEYMTQKYIPNSGGTVTGDLSFGKGAGIDLNGAKITNDDEGFSVADEDGVKKFGYDDGGFYVENGGEKEYIDDTYLRKEDYNETIVYDSGIEVGSDEHIEFIQATGNCVVSVVAKIKTGEDSYQTVEDIVWLPENNDRITYCSKNEGVYAITALSTGSKLCFQEGLTIVHAECRVLHGKCSLIGNIVDSTNFIRNIYPIRPSLHKVTNGEEDVIKGQFPLYRIFSTTNKCVVDVTANYPGRTYNDTIHIQYFGTGEFKHYTAYCEKNAGMFKWRYDGKKVTVYLCNLYDGENGTECPRQVTYRVVTEETRGCVTEAFGGMNEGKSDFYPPMLTASDLTYAPTVHVKNSNEFLDAVYLLNMNIYTPSGSQPQGRILLDSGLQTNWLCTHTIDEKTYYRGELGLNTDDDGRTLMFGDKLNNITIEGWVDRWKVVNVHGLWTYQKKNEDGEMTGPEIFSSEASYLCTIKADNLSFKNLWFGKRKREGISGYVDDGDGNLVQETVEEPAYKIVRRDFAKSVDQKRAMFEVCESLTLDGCRLDIQGLMKNDGNGEYVNENQYTFNNPLVNVYGKSDVESATVTLRDCVFASPFVIPGDGDYCVDDAIKIGDAVEGRDTKSCNVLISGCNIVADEHKRSTDSIVRVVKCYKKSGLVDEHGHYPYDNEPITPAQTCVFNIHRDTMKVENGLGDEYKVVSLPDESAKGPKILSENNSIVVTNNQDTNEVNIEVYEPGSKVVYADNLLQFLKGVKYINDNGKSGIIKVTGDIRFVDAMNDDWSPEEKTAFDEAGLQLNENTQTIGDYQNIIAKEIEFGDKLDGIQIEGVTPKAVFRTMPVRLTYKDASGNIKLYRRNNDATGNPVSTYGTIKADSLNFRNISLMRGNSATSNEKVTFEGKTYNDPYNKGTSGVDMRVFVINDNPFFKFAVSCKFENCDIYSQNTTYNDNKQVPLDFNWFSTNETDWNKFYPYDNGCILAKSDYTKTNADGDPIGKTIKIENCRLVSFCAYYGDATTSIQDEIGLDILLDCPQSVQDEVGIDVTADGVNRNRNLSPQVILTNCRVQQGSFAHNTRLHIECNKKNMSSNRNVRLNLYKGNVRTIEEELQTIRNNGIIVNEMD